MQERLEATVSGNVQGVGFRAFALIMALELGLKGYVRNNPDKGVEVVAEGEKEKLLKFVSSLEKGPPLSRVDSLKKGFSPAAGEFRNFSIM